jgi:hypothetical protein
MAWPHVVTEPCNHCECIGEVSPYGRTIQVRSSWKHHFTEISVLICFIGVKIGEICVEGLLNDGLNTD